MSDSSDTDQTKILKREKRELNDLIRKRGAIRARLTKFRDNILLLQKINPESLTKLQIDEVIRRISIIDTASTQFQSIQSQIETLTLDLDSEVDHRENIESTFFSLLAQAQAIVDSSPHKSPFHNDQEIKSVNECAASGTSGCFGNMRLPEIKLPKFNGNYLTWLEFKETFDSLINSNDSMPDINKFHYLRSSLEGEPRDVIKSIEFTSTNYKNAWQLLNDRYNNINILINNHLKSLFHFKHFKHESHKGIRFIIDHISKKLCALNALGQPTDKWDTLIIFMISNKLDMNTLSKWEEYKNNMKVFPCLEDFTMFLRNRADMLETLYFNKNNVMNTPRNDFNKHNANNNYKNATLKTFVTSRCNKPYRGEPSCPYYKQVHRLVDCTKFKELEPEIRLSECSKLNLCLNCLRRGHTVIQCTLGPCRICKHKHNTLLHINSNNNINGKHETSQNITHESPTHS